MFSAEDWVFAVSEMVNKLASTAPHFGWRLRSPLNLVRVWVAFADANSNDYPPQALNSAKVRSRARSALGS